MNTTRHLALALAALFVLSGCTAGYRYASYDAQVPSDVGEANLTATESKAQLGATIDFRYFRLLLYGEIGEFEGVVTDDRGLTDTFSERRSENWLGVDVPLLTLWDFQGSGCCTYPPFQKKRHAFELWASGAVSPSYFNWNGQLALVYYFERFIGAKLSGGISTVEFSGTTFDIDGASRRFDNLDAYGTTVSFSIVFPAGPWGESMLKELLFWDEQHRDQHGGY